MAMIDTKEWKEFRLRDLFTLERPAARVVRDYEDGNMPFIASGMNNNGVSQFVSPQHDRDFEKGNCLTVSPLDGSCFWQPSDFLGRGGSGASICILRNNDISERQGLFIASCIRNVLSEEAGYGNLYTGDKLLNVGISLPATPDGQPDWAYMDAYMGEVLKKEEVFAEHLASLTAEAVVDGHPLDTSSWKAFRIGELFEIRPTKAYKLTNSDLLNVNGNIPVVANSAQNNGVVGFSNLEATEKGGIITFSDTTDANAIFYQSHDFIGYAHVQGMYRKFEKVSDVVMLFLATAFQSQALKMNFDYANKFRRDIALNIEISLPVTADGMPDWTWMEQYMQRQMDKAAALVEHLDAVWN